MGVGVFYDDFDKTGSTFMVDGPLTNDDDYEDYLLSIAKDAGIVVEQAGDGDWNYRSEADAPDVDDGQYGSQLKALTAGLDSSDHGYLTSEGFSQDAYDHANEEFISIVERAGRNLGMSVTPRVGFSAERSDFDSDFVSIFDSKCGKFGVGWRSWEHDFVIAVAANKGRGGWQEELGSLEYNVDRIIDGTGRAPAIFKTLHDKVCADLMDYVRLTLANEGIKARYRTSGYTTSQYQVPEDIPGELAAIKARIEGGLKQLSASPTEAMRTQTTDEREALIKELYSASLRSDIDMPATRLVVPVFADGRSRVLWVDPLESQVTGEKVADLKLGQGTNSSVAGGLVSIERVDHGDWFDVEQGALWKRSANTGSAPALLISAEEFVNATGAKFAVAYDSSVVAIADVASRAERLAREDVGDAVGLGMEAAENLKKVQGFDDPESLEMTSLLKDIIALAEQKLAAPAKAELADRLESWLASDGVEPDQIVLLQGRGPSNAPRM